MLLWKMVQAKSIQNPKGYPWISYLLPELCPFLFSGSINWDLFKLILKNFLKLISGFSTLWTNFHDRTLKVEKMLKGSLDSIPSPLVKIQFMSGKVCLRCRGKTLLGVVNKLLKTKSLLASPNNVLPYYLK